MGNVKTKPCEEMGPLIPSSLRDVSKGGKFHLENGIKRGKVGGTRGGEYEKGGRAGRGEGSWGAARSNGWDVGGVREAGEH